VTQLGVDGFRFDLASTLARDTEDFDRLSPFLSAVYADPVLRSAKLIAEPWDVGPNGYQVGGFPAPWAEWNGQFRDTVREFWAGTSDGVRDLGYRLTGSSDRYNAGGRTTCSSVNFVTCHDGFTLRDLTTYSRKHNEANGERNADGANDNNSANYGVEGETDDADINALRRRQARNILATLLLSTGTPMLLAGDEVRRTQGGNNNAYCQDNETSWLDWDFDDDARALLDFAARLIALRRASPVLRQAEFFEGRPAADGDVKDLTWFTSDGAEMTGDDWLSSDRRTIALFLDGRAIRQRGVHGETVIDESYLLALHAGADDVKLTPPAGEWATSYEVVVDTGHEDGSANPGSLAAGASVPMRGRSLMLLRARRGE
jgi:glycogen operon protein